MSSERTTRLDVEDRAAVLRLFANANDDFPGAQLAMRLGADEIDRLKAALDAAETSQELHHTLGLCAWGEVAEQRQREIDTLKNSLRVAETLSQQLQAERSKEQDCHHELHAELEILKARLQAVTQERDRL